MLAAAVRRAIPTADAEPVRWAERFAELATRHRAAEETRSAECATARIDLAARADRMAADMDFRFLYNRDRELFSIGFNATTWRLDPSHHDLLASEACISSFLAIARGQVPRKHWFHLGRLTTRAAGEPGLVRPCGRTWPTTRAWASSPS